MQKAYKLLAQAKNISHNHAKMLIDKGLVRANGARLKLAREEIALDSRFEVQEIAKPQILYQNKDLLALEKPAFIESYELESFYKNDGFVLLHRLDRECSGVILLGREQSEFLEQAKLAFKKRQVYKEYRALVSGIFPEALTITKPITTHKKYGFAKSRIDKNGLEAITHIEPLAIQGKKSLLKVIIPTGRTHQIRVHLSSIAHPIVGDRIYGGIDYKRLLLHAHRIEILGHKITSTPPKELEL